MTIYSAEWRALAREGAIAGQSLSAGLASLRKANYAQTGFYSHAFFNLSIGLERILKLIFLVDYAIENSGKYPTEQELRNRFGHDIGKLLQHAIVVHQRLPEPEGRYPLNPDGLEMDVVKFLSKFAVRTRYYNLDFISGAKLKDDQIDPIAEWFSSIGVQILSSRYRADKRIKDQNIAANMDALLRNNISVRHTAEDGTPISNYHDAYMQSAQDKVIQKYGTFHCAKIGRFLYMILYELVRVANHRSRLNIPYLDEFFFPFMNDDAYLLSRKTFPPHGQ